MEDNLIIGGQCAVAFTGADECVFDHNTIVRPEKWVIRILQESRDPRFVRCGDNGFSNNLIVFERANVRDIANIGPDTRAETFQFAETTGSHRTRRTSHPPNPAVERDGWRPRCRSQAGSG